MASGKNFSLWLSKVLLFLLFNKIRDLSKELSSRRKGANLGSDFAHFCLWIKHFAQDNKVHHVFKSIIFWVNITNNMIKCKRMDRASRFSPGRLDGNLTLSWMKLNCENAPFTNARMNAFTITFIGQNYVRSVQVRTKYERVHERSFIERIQTQHCLLSCSSRLLH